MRMVWHVWSLQREQIRHLPCEGITPAWQPGARSPERTVTCLGLQWLGLGRGKIKIQAFPKGEFGWQAEREPGCPRLPHLEHLQVQVPRDPRQMLSHDDTVLRSTYSKTHLLGEAGVN